jgi:SAM-dependent methyltransferase
MRLQVRDDPNHPDAGFVELYEALPYPTDLSPWLDWTRSQPLVLYVGVGVGRLAVPLAHAGVRMVLLDAHPGMLEAAKRRLPGMEAVLSRVEDLASDRTFSCVIAPSSILGNRMRLESAARCVAAGGMLAFELMNPRWLLRDDLPASIRRTAVRRDSVDVEIDYTLPAGEFTQVATIPLVELEAVKGWLAELDFVVEEVVGGRSAELRDASTFCVKALAVHDVKPG